MEQSVDENEPTRAPTATRVQALEHQVSDTESSDTEASNTRDPIRGNMENQKVEVEAPPEMMPAETFYFLLFLSTIILVGVMKTLIMGDGPLSPPPDIEFWESLFGKMPWR